MAQIDDNIEYSQENDPLLKAMADNKKPKDPLTTPKPTKEEVVDPFVKNLNTIVPEKEVVKKEGDFFAMMHSGNLDFTNSDNVANSLRENLSLKDRDFYKDTPKIQKQFLNDKGEFDEDAYNKAYDAVNVAYNEWSNMKTTLIQAQELPDNKAYDNYYTRRLKLPTYQDVLTTKETNNAYNVSLGIVGINTYSAPDKSLQELAQGNNIWNSEKGRWEKYAPNDHAAFGGLGLGRFFEFMGDDPLVLATYDEDVLDNGVLKYGKGTPKLDAEGKPYYETIGDRLYENKELLAIPNIITAEDHWTNDLDFMDSDDIQKSIGGSVMKTVFQTGQYFIPYYNMLYIGSQIYGGLSSINNEVQKGWLGHKYGSDAKKTAAYKELDKNSARRKAFQSTVSQYTQDNFWTIENGLNFMGEILGQLYTQRGLANIPTYIKALAKNPTAMLGTSRQLSRAIVTGEQMAEATRKTQQLGSWLGSVYMAGTSAAEIADVARQSGLDAEDTGYLYGLYALGLMGLFRSDIGRMVEKGVGFDKVAKANRIFLRESAANLGKHLDDAVDKTAKLSAIRRFANTSIDGLKGIMKKASAGDDILGGALAEGFEEATEQAAQMALMGAYNTIRDLGYGSDKYKNQKTAKFKMDNIGQDLLMSFGMGMAGGAMFKAVGNLTEGKRNKNPEELTMKDYVLQGRTAELYEEIDRMRSKGVFGDKNLSLKVEKYVDGKPIYAKVDANNPSQNDVIADNLKRSIETLDAAVKYSLGDQTPKDIGKTYKANLQKIFAESPQKYAEVSHLLDTLLDLNSHTSIQDDIDDLVTKSINIQQKISDLTTNVTEKLTIENSVNNELADLQSELDIVNEELGKITSGAKADEYLEQALFNTRPDIHAAFGAYTFQQYVNDKISSGELTQQDLESGIDTIHQQYREEYVLSGKAAESLKQAKKAYDTYVEKHGGLLKNVAQLLNIDTDITSLIGSKKSIKSFLSTEHPELKKINNRSTILKRLQENRNDSRTELGDILGITNLLAYGVPLNGVTFDEIVKKLEDLDIARDNDATEVIENITQWLATNRLPLIEVDETNPVMMVNQLLLEPDALKNALLNIDLTGLPSDIQNQISQAINNVSSKEYNSKLDEYSRTIEDIEFVNTLTDGTNDLVEIVENVQNELDALQSEYQDDPEGFGGEAILTILNKHFTDLNRKMAAYKGMMSLAPNYNYIRKQQGETVGFKPELKTYPSFLKQLRTQQGQVLELLRVAERNMGNDMKNILNEANVNIQLQHNIIRNLLSTTDDWWTVEEKAELERIGFFDAFRNDNDLVRLLAESDITSMSKESINDDITAANINKRSSEHIAIESKIFELFNSMTEENQAIVTKLLRDKLYDHTNQNNDLPRVYKKDNQAVEYSNENQLTYLETIFNSDSKTFYTELLEIVPNIAPLYAQEYSLRIIYNELVRTTQNATMYGESVSEDNTTYLENIISVMGIPGVGKTKMVAQLAVKLINKLHPNKKILIGAPGTKQVEVLKEGLADVEAAISNYGTNATFLELLTALEIDYTELSKTHGINNAKELFTYLENADYLTTGANGESDFGVNMEMINSLVKATKVNLSDVQAIILDEVTHASLNFNTFLNSLFRAYNPNLNARIIALGDNEQLGHTKDGVKRDITLSKTLRTPKLNVPVRSGWFQINAPVTAIRNSILSLHNPTTIDQLLGLELPKNHFALSNTISTKYYWNKEDKETPLLGTGVVKDSTLGDWLKENISSFENVSPDQMAVVVQDEAKFKKNYPELLDKVTVFTPTTVQGADFDYVFFESSTQYRTIKSDILQEMRITEELNTIFSRPIQGMLYFTVPADKRFNNSVKISKDEMVYQNKLQDEGVRQELYNLIVGKYGVLAGQPVEPKEEVPTPADSKDPIEKIDDSSKPTITEVLQPKTPVKLGPRLSLLENTQKEIEEGNAHQNTIDAEGNYLPGNQAKGRDNASVEGIRQYTFYTTSEDVENIKSSIDDISKQEAIQIHSILQKIVSGQATLDQLPNVRALSQKFDLSKPKLIITGKPYNAETDDTLVEGAGIDKEKQLKNGEAFIRIKMVYPSITGEADLELTFSVFPSWNTLQEGGFATLLGKLAKTRKTIEGFTEERILTDDVSMFNLNKSFIHFSKGNIYMTDEPLTFEEFRNTHKNIVNLSPPFIITGSKSLTREEREANKEAGIKYGSVVVYYSNDMTIPPNQLPLILQKEAELQNTKAPKDRKFSVGMIYLDPEGRTLQELYETYQHESNRLKDKTSYIELMESMASYYVKNKLADQLEKLRNVLLSGVGLTKAEKATLDFLNIILSKDVKMKDKSIYEIKDDGTIAPELDSKQKPIKDYKKIRLSKIFTKLNEYMTTDSDMILGVIDPYIKGYFKNGIYANTLHIPNSSPKNVEDLALLSEASYPVVKSKIGRISKPFFELDINTLVNEFNEFYTRSKTTTTTEKIEPVVPKTPMEPTEVVEVSTVPEHLITKKRTINKRSAEGKQLIDELSNKLGEDVSSWTVEQISEKLSTKPTGEVAVQEKPAITVTGKKNLEPTNWATFFKTISNNYGTTAEHKKQLKQLIKSLENTLFKSEETYQENEVRLLKEINTRLLPTAKPLLNVQMNLVSLSGESVKVLPKSIVKNSWSVVLEDGSEGTYDVSTGVLNIKTEVVPNNEVLVNSITSLEQSKVQFPKMIEIFDNIQLKINEYLSGNIDTILLDAKELSRLNGLIKKGLINQEVLDTINGINSKCNL